MLNAFVIRFLDKFNLLTTIRRIAPYNALPVFDQGVLLYSVVIAYFGIVATGARIQCEAE